MALHVHGNLWYITLRRPWQNNNVKWPNSRRCGEREHLTVNFAFSVLTRRPFPPALLLNSSATLYTRWTNWNNHEAVQVTRTYIFKWRFYWRCRRGCVKSLFTRLNAAACIKFVAFPIRRLFEGGVYCKIIIFLKVQSYFVKQSSRLYRTAHCKSSEVTEFDWRTAKYGHLELRNIVMQENKFPRMMYITELYPACLFFFYIILE